MSTSTYADCYPDAQRAVARGWSIIPVKQDKTPYQSWKPHQSERAHPTLVSEWHTKFMPPAWAVVTGVISGVIVLDFDGEAGIATMKELGLEPHVRTGSGGFHVYVRHPGFQLSTLNGKAKHDLGATYPGMDIRADGGYAVFTGSNTSGQYTCLHELDDVYTWGQLPQDLTEYLIEASGNYPDRSPAPKVAKSSEAASLNVGLHDEEQMIALINHALARSESNGRNNSGFQLACEFRDRGFSIDEARFGLAVYQQETGGKDQHGNTSPYTNREAMASLQQAYENSPTRPSHGQRLASVIVNNRQLPEISQEVMAAITHTNDPPSLFTMGGSLVRIATSDDGRTRIEPHTNDTMTGHVTRCADFFRLTTNMDGSLKYTAVFPPAAVVRDVLSIGSWPTLPELRGIIDRPAVRPDGTITHAFGFDHDSGLFINFASVEGRLAPEQPSDEAVAAAAALLTKDLFGDFPFQDQASAANAVGLLITGVLREAIDAPIPMALIDAPTAGTGKSLLAAVMTLAGTGRVVSPTTMPFAEEETRKKITSLLLTSPAFIVIDNVDDVLRQGTLSAALTSRTWTDRLLGQTRMVDVPQNAIWIATGNNLRVGGDVARRCFTVRLDSLVARPWCRTNFKHSDLLSWTIEHRVELIAAVHTLHNAWHSSGRPEANIPGMGTFTPWARMIGGILEHAGVEGFLTNVAELYERGDEEAAEWTAFLRALEVEQLEAGDPLSASQILYASKRPDFPTPSKLAESIAKAGSEKAAITRIGRMLGRYECRRFDDTGLRIHSVRDSDANAKRYAILRDAVIKDPEVRT